jgi:hypothetical protein
MLPQRNCGRFSRPSLLTGSFGKKNLRTAATAAAGGKRKLDHIVSTDGDA